MRIEHVDVDDNLVRAADELWPDATWTEVFDYALALAVADARTTDLDDDDTKQHTAVATMRPRSCPGRGRPRKSLPPRGSATVQPASFSR